MTNPVSYVLPPFPTTEASQKLWMDQLRVQVSTATRFVDLNFVNSNMTSIVTRNHDDLQNVHGTGTYHLSATEAAALVGSGSGVYTPTLSGFGGVTGASGKWIRLGNQVTVWVTLTTATSITVLANSTCSLPNVASFGGVMVSNNPVGPVGTISITGTILSGTSVATFPLAGTAGVSTLLLQATYSI